MKLSRNALITHLNRIHTGGMIVDAILRPNLSCSALHPSNKFFVDAPALTDEEIFPEPVGVVGLGTLIKVLKKTAKGGGKEVEFYYDPEAYRIIVEEGAHTVSLNTADPEVIGTRLSDDIPDGSLDLRDQFLEDFEQNGVSFPIPEYIADAIQDMQKLVGYDSIELRVSEEGTEVVVGRETGDFDLIAWEDVRWPQAYTERYRSDAFVAALDRIDNFEEAEIAILGPDDTVAVQYQGYSYVLNPMES